MPLNVAVIFSNYGPYHIARVRAFHNHAQQYGWNVCGIELARLEAKYPWSIDPTNLPFTIHSVISDQSIETIPLLKLLPLLYQVLEQVKPDVLAVSGYGTLPMLAALAWGKWHRKSAILFSDTKADDASRSVWQETIKRWIVHQYQAALVAGQVHKQYLLDLGMAEDTIFLGYDVVENATFHPEILQGLPEPLNRPYFLTISRFVPKKNLSLLVNAYAAYRQQVGDRAWDLVICGEGHLQPQLEQQIAQLGLRSVIHLPGFLQQQQLLPYFAHAHCFIHASIQEQWGLVVNEAMAAGLPVLVSNRCGCFDELVIEGVTGFGFDPENQQALTDLMIKMGSDAIDRKALGQAAFTHIQAFSPDLFAQNLVQAINHTITARSASLSSL